MRPFPQRVPVSCRLAWLVLSAFASAWALWACGNTEPVEATSPCVIDGECERRESQCVAACDGGSALHLFCESGHWLASLQATACTEAP